MIRIRRTGRLEKDVLRVLNNLKEDVDAVEKLYADSVPIAPVDT